MTRDTLNATAQFAKQIADIRAHFATYAVAFSFSRAFTDTKRLVMVNGSYDHQRDEWTLVALVNGHQVEKRSSVSAHEDSLDMIEVWGTGAKIEDPR